MAEKRPTPVKPLTIYFYHTRLTRESYEEWKDYKFPGHILYGLPLLEKYGIRSVMHKYKAFPSRLKLMFYATKEILCCKEPYEVLYGTSFRGLELIILLRALGFYRKPIVILLMLPLIFIGIVLGLLLLGKTFDFFAILGLLGLIGMNIKNAIVLVDQIDTETAAGKAPREAVISATTTRIVPVAMASGTTILGMLPLLFDAMFGGMAATIMGGLLVASALTLFVLPVAYCAIHKIK